MSKPPLHGDAGSLEVSLLEILEPYYLNIIIVSCDDMPCLILFLIILQHVDYLLWCFSRRLVFIGSDLLTSRGATEFFNNCHHHLGWSIGFNYMPLTWTMEATLVFPTLVTPTPIISTHCWDMNHNFVTHFLHICNFYVSLLPTEWKLKTLTQHSLPSICPTHSSILHWNLFSLYAIGIFLL